MSKNVAVYYNNQWITVGYKHAQGRLFHCSCGYKHHSFFKGEFKCPKCDTEHLVYLDRRYKTKIIETPVKAVSVEMKGFHVEKERYRLVFHKDDSISVKFIHKEEIKYSLYNGVTMTKGEETFEPNSTHINKFFGDLIYDKIINLISNDTNRGLYRYAYNQIYSRGRGWSYDRSMGTGLKGLLGKKHIELFYFAGFTNETVLSDLDNYAGRFNFKESKLHNILKVPKLFVPIMKGMSRYSSYTINEMKDLYDIIGGNNFKTVFNILMEETNFRDINMSNFCGHFKTLYTTYGYTNVERLATYVCRDLKLQQGMENPVDGLQYLRDYVRMMDDLGYEPEKYSKSLKKDHDIANMNFKIIGDKIYAEKLSKKVKEKEYQILKQKGKEFSIITPTIADDVVKEGESLSHCVASYVKDIARGLCKIVFLRRTESLDVSNVTIEVRGGCVKQVRGRGNRTATQEERDFVTEWAKEKKLELSYY